MSPSPRFKVDAKSEVHAWLSEQLSLNKVCDVTEFVAGLRAVLCVIASDGGSETGF